MCTTATTDRLLLLDTQPVDSLSLAAALLKDRVEAPPSWGCHSVENTVEFQVSDPCVFFFRLLVLHSVLAALVDVLLHVVLCCVVFFCAVLCCAVLSCVVLS
mgnify:FL=1